MLLKKWRERDAAKLRKLEKQVEQLQRERDSLKLCLWGMQNDYGKLEKRVKQKEVTHIQKVKVELTKPFDYDGWLP